MSTKKKKPKVPMPRRFYLRRDIDDSGISGTGYVACGVQWPTGKVTIEWIVGDHPSQENHNTLEDCMAVHGHGKHTKVEWLDGMNTFLE